MLAEPSEFCALGTSREGVGAITTASSLTTARTRARSQRSVVHDPRADFNFREHGARVLSLDEGPRTEDRLAGRARGG